MRTRPWTLSRGSPLARRAQRTIAWRSGSHRRRLRRDRSHVTGDQGRAQHHRAWSQRLARPRLAERSDTPPWRRPTDDRCEGPDAAGRPAQTAGTGDDGRPDASVALGIEEPRQAGDGAARDGPQGERIEPAEAAGA